MGYGLGLFNGLVLDHLSKFLSLVLRHKPEQIGLQLDDQGWAEIAVLIDLTLNEPLLHEIVTNNDKQRFALSADGLRIRANQGHSLPIELSLTAQVPPDILLHGTATRFWDAIQATGLSKMQRHHVHLTSDLQIARAVGAQYGKVVVLQIDAKPCMRRIFSFFVQPMAYGWLIQLHQSLFIKRFLLIQIHKVAGRALIKKLISVY